MIDIALANPQTNSAFSKTIPTLQVAWDSTSLGLLKECPRKYQLTLVEGWVHKRTALPLLFGIWYHSALEAFDHARAEGNDYDGAVRRAVRKGLEISGERIENEFKPYVSDDSNRTRRNLIRTIVWYLDQFKDDPAQTVALANGKPAVELSFRFEIPLKAPDSQNYILCGHMDRLVTFADEAYVMDRKSTTTTLSSHYFKQFHPDNQMSLYSLAGKVVYNIPVRGVIIDAAQVAVGFTRYQRDFAHRTDEELEEWYEEAQIWLQLNEQFVKLGRWPMNDKSCQKYGGCVFQGICNKAPSVRETFLKADFEKRIWDPLKVRGD